MKNGSSVIGIIGGGQLARMSTQAAQQMGFAVVILDPDPDCPAAQVTPWTITAKIDDRQALQELAGRCDVLTLENEWVAADDLRRLQDSGATVRPGADTMERIGDKLSQQQHLERCGLPIPPTQPVASQKEARAIAQEWGYPLVLKARFGGYDGYGVRIIRSEADWKTGFTDQAHGQWYAQKYVSFERELAVMVARDPVGQVAVYPVVESAQTKDGHRCDWVVAPATGLSEHARSQAANLAARAVAAIDGVGLFGVELFLTREDDVLINEIAPRPHNSGHYTMDACLTSQFAQHIRAVCGLTLGPTDLLCPAAAMTNLLGVSDGPFDVWKGLARALAAAPAARVHWYGKAESRKGRKMGHINVLAQDADSALRQAQAARTAFWREE